MNILLSSVGRRPYLVRWFCEALADHGLTGSVIAADLDPRSPARTFADDFVTAPRVTDPGYQQWLQDFLHDRDVTIAVSINDFELSTWARLPTTPEWDPLVRLTAASQSLVEDKYAMSLAFREQGMSVPHTWLGGAAGRAAQEGEPGRDFVVKGRFGSASRGLRFTDAAGLSAAVADATHEVTDRQGRPAHEQRDIDPRELVIIQERIVGPEYGLDVVCDLDANYAGVLARRKITMRAGETDRAESVCGADFATVGHWIADAVPHAGTVDVDVMVADDGLPYVIDVNPRFGGGYPFSHLAGARVPHAYVAWAAGLPIQPEWLTPEIGVVSGKYVEAVRIG